MRRFGPAGLRKRKRILKETTNNREYKLARYFTVRKKIDKMSWRVLEGYGTKYSKHGPKKPKYKDKRKK